MPAIIVPMIWADDARAGTAVSRAIIPPLGEPEAFFKAVLLRYQDEGGSGERYETRVWIVENWSNGFSGFEQNAEALEVSIDQLEDVIDMDLYPKLVRLVGVAVAGDVEYGC